ncbi:2-amino-4-hydroxy-6-hydroxymethyldihydropteridine diphosphokinase [Shewanella morhuae]|uniref:2-amino-4-hydroxy-6-hydroxymethyldihydropteridine pyrophosphokinase n=1 Tax=Shewanella morhuae TaxID=365591 RepID=A0ABX5HXK6_9GAMM|nr:2-amino-4-hydroxy-6-hydroxymethyldihydropteridine diphosphokinase [Shewanella morhuae]PTA51230.1 2-amino-4-hydroxy-6-hydroxymethyldihydropteridine diphosphokinase [Shewanella morhuae]GIU09349.1 2-amino-4-hydroxy-6-hydroxymethyldihydropteridine diphosphokinase [Shewanella morhuae]SIQ77731.1 2-amino-4-hydroxy-6-hydroxymethyldihydropteridinediphosphokinase [Shewanella morhuae]
MPRVYVALGANLEDPKAQLDNAVAALSILALENRLQVSPYYRSVPMGDVVQPDYVNAVVSFDTELTPLALLDALQQIENTQGRIRLERWGPRTLDLDLLLYGNENIDIPRLKVPHYGMKERSFVLVPLAAIAPSLILPCGTAITCLIDAKMLAELQQLGIDH